MSAIEQALTAELRRAQDRNERLEDENLILRSEIKRKDERISELENAMQKVKISSDKLKTDLKPHQD